MGEEEKTPNLMIYLDPDLVNEILLRLPFKSIVKFKTVSKQWKSILESKSFMEIRMIRQKKPKILAAYNCNCGNQPSLLPESRFEGDEEIVYLHCDATRASITCEGLVCIPETDCISVLNPRTRKLLRFRSGPDPLPSRFVYADRSTVGEKQFTYFPGDWIMGFGRDKVTGSYKVVRMRFEPAEEEECEILNVQTGEWLKLNPPPYNVDIGRKSVCVNGSIYWLNLWPDFKILALNLHTQEFSNVRVPNTWVVLESQLLNLEDRLAIGRTKGGPNRKLEILSMDAKEEIWSITHSISLASLTFDPRMSSWFTPLTVSKLGHIVFCDNHKRLFKYYPEMDEIRCLSSDVSVISPFMLDLSQLRSESKHHSDLGCSDYKIKTSRCGLFPKYPEPRGSKISKLLKRINFGVLDIVFATLVVGCYVMKPR